MRCPATRPVAGWPAPCSAVDAMVTRMTDRRRSLLETRGLLVYCVKVPPAQSLESFRWVVEPPDAAEQAIWFIDGSLYDESRVIAHRAGFGIVVVSQDGALLGYGSGVPSACIHDAAGAEAWAFFQVTLMSPTVPCVVTDCLGIVDTLRGGARAAVGENRMLARLWAMIAHNLDGDFSVAAARTVWMPAHGARHTIGHVLKSDGTTLTGVE